MPLFQTSVLNKYLAEQDKHTIATQFQLFKNYFLNATIQQNIIASKEEEFQEGFLRELFVKVLGYTINPEPNFNLITELKNEKDSKKADGAIIEGENVWAVIELKSTKTTDLNKIETQAFSYKNNQANCKYVITSNFQKLRFYIDNAIEFVEWDLFKLTERDFALFYLCLHKDSLLKHIPATIKNESVTVEENVTKRLYKEYSQFRRNLFQNISEQNPQFDKLILFKKTQKLLDRFLFLFFAEDRMLVPPNSVREILKQWETLKELDAYQPLYERFKLYFGYLNTGHQGKVHEIFAYNGGLFANDDVLDNVKVDDTILYDAALSLSNYDYNTEVDVNILGHIFEHSLTEIEELENELKDNNTHTTKTTKRKKDGVFYTPKYITKYIVENTIGTLCKNKKEELQLQEEDYHSLTKKEKKKLFELLQKYRNWLLQITIVDPACGSGAFLNQALEYLINEHKWIAESEANITGSSIVFDIESSILENNLFGVDINEESVEIAKLSLWLRTAQKGRKLNSLNNNIKCGNSLIDDPAVAGDKAFNWQHEFPQIFERGGFDVVIGNPPYVRVQGLKEAYLNETTFYENKYTSATGNYDIYAIFMEKSFSLINSEGTVSFILPHKFLIADFGIGIRKFFKEKNCVEKILHFGSTLVFSDASTYTCIINLNKDFKDKLYFKKVHPFEISSDVNFDSISYELLTERNWDLQGSDNYNLIAKLNSQPYKVEDVFQNIFVGLQTSLDEVYVFEGKEYGNLIKGFNKKLNHSFEIEKELVKPFIKGNEISKWKNLENRYFVLFPYILVGTKHQIATLEYIENKLPLTFEYLTFCKRLIKSRENGKLENSENWFAYIYPKNLDKFHAPKIMTQEISLGCNMTYDENGEFYHPTTIYSFVKNPEFKVHDKFYLAIMNSKVMWFFLKNTGTELSGGFFRFKTNYLKPFPLPPIPSNAEDLIDLVNIILSKSKELQQANTKFQKLLTSNFTTLNLNSKLEKWYELSFTDFNKELTKQKIKLSLSEQSEWLTFFEQEKQKALAIKNEIDRTDKEIDQMVYQLYGLTDEEIKIVEGNE